MRLRRESYINLLDLTSFVLVTPDLVGKERLDKLREVVSSLWTRAITYFANKPLSDDELRWVNAFDHWALEVLTGAAIVTLFDEHLPRQGRTFYRFALTAVVAIVIIEIQELWKATAGTPVSQLMLLAGAMLFITTRILAIHSVQHEARQISERTSQPKAEPAASPPPVAEPAIGSAEARSAIALPGGLGAARALGARLLRTFDGPFKIFEGVLVRAAGRSAAIVGSLGFADWAWIEQHDIVGRPVADVGVGILGFVGIVLLLRRLGFWLCLLSIGFVGGIYITLNALDGGMSAVFVLGAILIVGCWFLLGRAEALKYRSPASQEVAPSDNTPAGTAEGDGASLRVSDDFVRLPRGGGRPSGRLVIEGRNLKRRRDSK
jgi:hypothetical protein